MELKQNYIAKNDYVVVKVVNTEETLGNGIKIQDTRGKRDIACGVCLLAEDKHKIPSHALVWFPIYAASPIKLEGENLLILPYEDIMLIERVPE
jgi:co-chaperonin GroES (HSP10)